MSEPKEREKKEKPRVSKARMMSAHSNYLAGGLSYSEYCNYDVRDGDTGRQLAATSSTESGTWK